VINSLRNLTRTRDNAKILLIAPVQQKIELVHPALRNVRAGSSSSGDWSPSRRIPQRLSRIRTFVGYGNMSVDQVQEIALSKYSTFCFKLAK
jgi:hypothetical protein